jgi:nucleotide-binding universal stress UspA family protein
MPTRHTTRRILVPLDGSELGRATIPHLRALATVESEILLLRVLPDSPPPVDTNGGQATAPDDRAARFERGEAQLREIATALRDITPRVEQLASIGNAADEILRVAEDRDIDLILMATHGLGTPEHPLTDSVTNRVAQAAAVPVMILPPSDAAAVPVDDDGSARYGCVVVPLDGSSRARAALPIAAALARRQLCPVRLVRAMPERDELFPDDGDPAREDECERYYAAWRANLAEGLRDEARELPAHDLPCEPTVLTGQPVPAITDYLRPGDILVLASHGEGGMRPWLLGTVAQQLIAAAPTPVVLVPVEERQALTSALRQQDRPARILQRRLPCRPEPVSRQLLTTG